MILLISAVYLFHLTYVESVGFSTIKMGRVPLWNATLTDKLKQDLLLNYDKFSRPEQHTNVTVVQFGMDIKHVEVNEFKSTLTVSSMTRLVWTDSKLKWNEDLYGGIGQIHVAPHEIWQPDLVLYNSAVTTGISQESLNLHIYSNGEVLWVPTSQFPVLCDFNFLHWPFDSQVCTLVIGSWSYHGFHIDLLYYGTDGKSINKEILVDNTEWNITEITYSKSSTTHDCCKDPYPTLKIRISLQRISSPYKTLVITPTFVVSVLILLSFWLPPQSGEKILLNGITAFIITAFMVYFAQKIPAMGSHTPLIVLFYSSSLYVLCFSIINSVLVIWMTRTQHAKPTPWFLRSILTGKFGVWLGLSNHIKQAEMGLQHIKAEEIRDHQVTSFEYSSSKKYNQDWLLLAVAIDRISFIFYSLLFVILTSKYTV